MISIAPSNSLLLPTYFWFYMSNVFPLMLSKITEELGFFDRYTSLHPSTPHTGREAFFCTLAKDVIDFHLGSAYH